MELVFGWTSYLARIPNLIRNHWWSQPVVTDHRYRQTLHQCKHDSGKTNAFEHPYTILVQGNILHKQTKKNKHNIQTHTNTCTPIIQKTLLDNIISTIPWQRNQNYIIQYLTRKPELRMSQVNVNQAGYCDCVARQWADGQRRKTTWNAIVYWNIVKQVLRPEHYDIGASQHEYSCVTTENAYRCRQHQGHVISENEMTRRPNNP